MMTPFRRSQSPRRQWLLRWQGGESAIEFLMILTFGVLPMMLAAWLFADVLKEYVALNQIFLSSPFF